MALVHLTFNDVYVEDINTKYALYYNDVGTNGNSFGTSNAIIVEDINNIPIEGYLNSTSGTSGLSNIFTFDYDYENNIQGNRIPNQPIDIVVVCIGRDIAMYSKHDKTLTNDVQTIIIDTQREK